MSLGEIIYSILIKPLQLLFEVVFMVVNNRVNYPGLSIIALSLIMNILVLPLYMRADAMQETERVLEAKMHKGVTHIKKTFKGDERMMMLQTYYRQNDYKPTDVFKGSVSLFLEIPFFIAAYQFLSNLALLKGSSFGPISDLGVPDALLHIGAVNLNVLPIIMTAVNLISCVIFTKGHPKKTKLQLYGMAVFFLIFLYDSPAGLVFYWTLNNVFSLVKTIFYKLKNPGKVLKSVASVAGLVIIGYIAITRPVLGVKYFLALMAIAIALLCPAIVGALEKFFQFQIKMCYWKSDKRVFITGSVYLTILLGVLIPSSVISTSPQEFTDIQNYLNPTWYIVSSLCLAVGLFMVWFGVFYWLAGEKYQCYFDMTIWILAVTATVDYLFFAKNMGILSSNLIYTSGFSQKNSERRINLLVICILVILLALMYKKGKKYIPRILIIASFAFFIMSGKNVFVINESVSDVETAAASDKIGKISFKLSQKGKNVVVIMLDQAMGGYIPYMINEKPELKEQLSGFTYYPNTISFGGSTNFGTPALYGGYEYTPEEINSRSDESLKDKQNEALKVMPVLFNENGYEVTVCDPTYANYQWTPDLSIYDEYPEIHSYISMGAFITDKKTMIDTRKRNFFCYSVMKAAPMVLQDSIYNEGQYYYSSMGNQRIIDSYHAEGISSHFMRSYTTLQRLSEMTEIVDGDTNTFVMMSNDTTHDLSLLQEPEYVPADVVDNTEYEQKNGDRFVLNGVELNMDTFDQYQHYQSNMAAILKLADWMDFLKKNGVYDNTRIIITADHGSRLNQIDDLKLNQGSDQEIDTERFYPLLMIKDFNSKKFSVSDEFMTNGDVPTYAVKDLVENPTNPFTGKEINNSAKYKKKQYILDSLEWDVNKNNGNQFLPGLWLSVHNDRLNKDNWEILNEGIFPDEK